MGGQNSVEQKVTKHIYDLEEEVLNLFDGKFPLSQDSICRVDEITNELLDMSKHNYCCLIHKIKADNALHNINTRW